MLEDPIMRRPLHVVRLDDEGALYRLAIECLACGRRTSADPHALAKIVGWATTLESLSYRMKCTKCGSLGCRFLPLHLPARDKGPDLRN